MVPGPKKNPARAGWKNTWGWYGRLRGLILPFTAQLWSSVREIFSFMALSWKSASFILRNHPTRTPTHTHTHNDTPTYLLTRARTHTPPASDGCFYYISASLRYPLSVFNKNSKHYNWRLSSVTTYEEYVLLWEKIFFQSFAVLRLASLSSLSDTEFSR